MTTQETFSKLEEEQMSPQYELDAQGRIVNYCLSLVASDRAAADWQEGTGNAADKDSEKSSMELPPLNPLPTSMSSSTSALASIHQEISNYLSTTPKSTVKYGDVQVHLGWKITKAADLGASMGEIKKFVKWKVDAHNKRVAKESAPLNGGDFSQSEGEFSDQGKRFEGASISRRKKNVSENISVGFGESLSLGKENKKWAFLILGLSIVTYFFSGTIIDIVSDIVDSISDAIEDVKDFGFLSIFEDVGADTFLQPLRQIFGSIIGLFGALVHFVTAGPKAFTSMLAQSISLITRIDIPTLRQFGISLFFPMTSIGPVAHPVYYVLLSVYAFLFTRYLRKEDLMIYEHIGDSPLFSQIFTPAFVAFICYHFLTSSLGPVLGMDAMLLQSNEFLRSYGEDGFRAKLGLMGGQSPCGIAELCPQYYFGTGESLGMRFPMAEGMSTVVALTTRVMLAGFLILGGLDRWRARREIRGARV